METTELLLKQVRQHGIPEFIGIGSVVKLPDGSLYRVRELDKANFMAQKLVLMPSDEAAVRVARKDIVGTNLVVSDWGLGGGFASAFYFVTPHRSVRSVHCFPFFFDVCTAAPTTYLYGT